MKDDMTVNYEYDGSFEAFYAVFLRGYDLKETPRRDIWVGNTPDNPFSGKDHRNGRCARARRAGVYPQKDGTRGARFCAA